MMQPKYPSKLKQFLDVIGRYLVRLILPGMGLIITLAGLWGAALAGAWGMALLWACASAALITWLVKQAPKLRRF